MRHLGIDYGTKHVGLAISDEGGMVAFPLAMLPNTKEIVREIMRICEEREVSEIVMGESRDLSGKVNPVQEKIEVFRRALEEAVGLPVRYEPEFFSSVEAKKRGALGKPDRSRWKSKTSEKEVNAPRSRSDRRAHNDASAAAVILQSYLDKRK